MRNGPAMADGGRRRSSPLLVVWGRDLEQGFERLLAILRATQVRKRES